MGHQTAEEGLLNPANSHLPGQLLMILSGSNDELYHVVSAGLLRNTEVPLRNWAGDVVGHTVLPGAVFDVDVRRDILHRVVRWQLARRQQVMLRQSYHVTGVCVSLPA